MSHISIGKRVTLQEQMLRTWSGGTTRELFVYPPDASFSTANYDFWVGTATIERSVDYSYFPGYMRVHLPIRGNGLSLHFCETKEAVQLTTYQQHLFDGAAPVYAELVNEPVTAFNIILRSNLQACADVVILEKGSTIVVKDIAKIANGSDTDVGNSTYVLYAITGSTSIHTAEGQNIIVNEEEAFVLNGIEADQVFLAQIELQSAGISSEVIIAKISF